MARSPYHWRGWVPVIAFFCGLFPQQALHYLRAKTPVFRGGTAKRADELPLDMIEGMSPFHQARLNEVGIDNAQNHWDLGSRSRCPRQGHEDRPRTLVAVHELVAKDPAVEFLGDAAARFSGI
jgi:hypothetical protein